MTRERPSVREMETGDLEAVLAIEVRVFPSPWTGEIFSAELEQPESIYLVVEEPGGTVGYAGARMFGQEVHITNMAVAPERRGRGLAAALMLECVRRGIEQGGRYLTLEVRQGNAGALEFYRKFGFAELGLRRGYYHETGEDAVIMATGDLHADSYRALFSELRRRFEREGGE
jgi:ribosomal-protein-alanine N-acetyltransferase